MTSISLVIDIIKIETAIAITIYIMKKIIFFIIKIEIISPKHLIRIYMDFSSSNLTGINNDIISYYDNDTDYDNINIMVFSLAG